MLIDVLIGLAIGLCAMLLAHAADLYLTQQQVEYAPLILTGVSVAALAAFFMIKGDNK